jgi:hypothetical protein
MADDMEKDDTARGDDGPDAAGEHREYGVLAEFATPDDLMFACAGVRDHGYSRWDAHTPFPVHGLEKAMGLRRSAVSVFVLVLGLAGAAGGMLLQWWTSAVNYPLVISGKPFFSWQAFVPITFELGVLGGAVAAVVGMLALNQLPMLFHPLFGSKRFERVTDDGFFISIESWDPKFDVEATRDMLERLGATHVELISADSRAEAS